MVILGAHISVQREISVTVQWLSFHTTVGSGSSLDTLRGALCIILDFPDAMLFPMSLVCSSHISSQHLPF